MNEIKSSEFGFNQPKPVSSAPQVQSSDAGKTNQMKAEAVNTVQKSGKGMPQDAQQTAEAKSVEVKEAVAKLNEYVQSTQRNLDFQLDEDSGRTVVRVYDSSSERLVRQIPDEVALELAKNLNGEEPPLLFNAQI